MISLTRAESARTTSHDTPPADSRSVTVQPGDSLHRIATEHGVPLQALIDANPQLRNPDVIYPGTRLNLPETERHAVKPGDTLHGIAQQHGVSLQALLAANPQVRNPDLIHVGELLRLPAAAVGHPGSGGLLGELLKLLPTPVYNQLADLSPTQRQQRAAETAARPDTAVPQPVLAQQTRPADAAATASLDLRRFTDPAQGSNALAAIVIGNAEGTRRPDGGFTAAFGGHTDPGNAVHNRGSFSYQHAASSPADADRRQLQTLQGRLPVYEAAATGAGLNANDPRLASAYLDLYNQSPTAAARFLNQIGTLAGQPITTERITDLRVNSFVDASTGERFRLANGGQAGSGFVNIARNQLGRTPTEAEVQAVIRADQQRRTTAVESALNAQGLLAAAPATPVAAAPGAGGAPRWLEIARGELGTNEVRGASDNARVVAYHQTTTLRANDDETSWCSSFVNWTMGQAGIQGTNSAAARSWLNWGESVPINAANVRPGDVIVFPRGNNPAQGHVAIVDEVLANGRVRVVGGNQSNGEGQPDGVTESVRSLSSAIGVRRAP